jgi:hypothetical protein
MAKKEDDPENTTYEVNFDGLADILSVFDGPRGDINKDAEDVGMKSMPPIDTKSKELFDVLNNVHFASIIVAILSCMPLFVIFAPKCTSWRRVNDFNTKKLKPGQGSRRTRKINVA